MSKKQIPTLPYLVDSHAHLDFPDFARDKDEVLKRAERSGIKLIINVGFDIASSRKAVKLAESVSFVYAAVGIHPHDSGKAGTGFVKELENMCSHPRVVALGEMGLDFYRDRSLRAKQREVFKQQLQLSHRLNLPIIIHSRDAHEEVVDILKKEGVPPAGGVMHCFSGDTALAQEVMELNLAVSIAGPVTYRKNDKLAEVASYVPQEQLLVETDAPFLSPEPVRGRRNEPANVAYVVQEIASLRGISAEELGRICLENTARIFSIDTVL